MTYQAWLTRRRLLHNAALSAAVPAVSGWSTENQDSIPGVDSIEEHLGISLLSYESVSGELWYREVFENPDWSEDCIYSVEQAIGGQDSEIAVSESGSDVVLNAEFKLQVIPSSTATEPPLAYQDTVSKLGYPEEVEETPGIDRSKVSVGAYPGLLYHKYADHFGDNAGSSIYTQALPWGVVYWHISYSRNLEVTLPTEEYQDWLQSRKQRDWHTPSMAAKDRWKILHGGEQNTKGWFTGDISQLIEDGSDITRAELQQVDGTIGQSGQVDQSAAIDLASS
jgi:hypothetical protein